MRRLTGTIALCLLLATTANAQVNLGGNVGLEKAQPSQRLSTIPTDQFISIVYPWTSVLGASGTGWTVQQSTAAGVTFTPRAPFLEIAAGTANRRALLWEEGASADLASATNVDKTGEITVSVPIFGLDLIAASTTGWFQLGYGDSTNFKVNKIPGRGFGIICSGTTNADTLFAPQGSVTAYVSDEDEGDTTYVPCITPASQLTIAKLWIHAVPNNGPVSFWINDVLQATIPRTAGSGVKPASTAIWLNGATGLSTVIIGPLTVQREWP